MALFFIFEANYFIFQPNFSRMKLLKNVLKEAFYIGTRKD